MKEPLDVPMVSTVITASSLVRIMSRLDKLRFKKLGVRFSATTGGVGSFLSSTSGDTFINRLGRLPANKRVFNLTDSESLGRPYVWFTAKDDLDNAIAARAIHGKSAADVARDLLGLIHHGKVNWETGGDNHLFAIHIPASVVQTATYMRPASPQAFDNRRFILRFDTEPAKEDDWGRTIDLSVLATQAGVHPIGGRERVLLRLQRSVVPDGTMIGFDYLGCVSDSRGTIAGRDDDPTFLNLVRRSRNATTLVRQMCR